MVNQQKTRCVPKKKNTDGSLFTLVSFYRFLGSSIFPFIPFF